jgi:hypothetical protein
MRIVIKSLVKTLIKLTILVILPVGLIVVYGYSVKGESSVLRPTDCKEAVKIQVGEKLRTYYTLRADEPLTLNIRGPARLRAITRVDFNTAISRARDYKIKVYMDQSNECLAFEKKSKPSFISKFADVENKTPGKIRNIYLDIPEGKHNLVFCLDTNKSDSSVRMRFLVNRESESAILERKMKKWSFVRPKKYKEHIVLYIENNKRDYYRFGTGAPLEIEARGPAVLKILTRLEFSDMVQKRCDYNLKVYEDNKFKTEHFFQTKRASKVAYAKDTGLNAGVKGLFLLEVPKGQHRYSIELNKPAFLSVLCRPFVKIRPKAD